ncbi:hypothetical protein F5146DRAFT_99172 [Armillaria mellea]|nr:hypothetical protein F5146DRAFT_99172 [Armillaria mellea]
MLYFIALFFLAVSTTFAAVIPRDESSAANSYSGNSGPANGGNSTNEGIQLISLFSNNAGEGGFTPTGSSSAQSGGSSTSREDREETQRQRTTGRQETKPSSANILEFVEVPTEDC